MKYLDDDEFNAVKSELTIYDGKTIAEEELKKQIMRVQIERAQKQGRVVLNNTKGPCKITLTNYIGVKLLFKMIHGYHDHKPIVPILPAMCYSTDDTTDYIYEGYGNNRKGLFRLVSNKSLKNVGSLSRYRINNSKAMNGMRVKLTYTFSAAGTMAPIFISILGLTEKELPEDE